MKSRGLGDMHAEPLLLILTKCELLSKDTSLSCPHPWVLCIPIVDMAKNEATIHPFIADHLTVLVEFFNLCILTYLHVDLPSRGHMIHSTTPIILSPVLYAMFDTAFIIALCHADHFNLGT